jgi:hypothetical protein
MRLCLCDLHSVSTPSGCTGRFIALTYLVGTHGYCSCTHCTLAPRGLLGFSRGTVILFCCTHAPHTALLCASYAAVCEQHDFDKHWRMLWFFDAFWHSLYFVLMCVCALLWAPSANSKMYAPTLGTHSNSRTRRHSWSERCSCGWGTKHVGSTCTV